jgi:hypothetical protein
MRAACVVGVHGDHESTEEPDMSRSRAAGSVLVLLLVAATGAGLLTGASAHNVGAGAHANVALRFTVNHGTGHRSTARLSCRGVARTARGYLRHRPVAACRTARRLATFLASRPSPDQICSQQYGGPQTARIRGTIGHHAIDKRLSRRDGCAIYDWDRAGVLLPASSFAP